MDYALETAVGVTIAGRDDAHDGSVGDALRRSLEGTGPFRLSIWLSWINSGCLKNLACWVRALYFYVMLVCLRFGHGASLQVFGTRLGAG